ncbi:MAG TPA: hypothetical protein VN947_00655 [Polyangia bacterium]|nr:hypothetical protein [Polyangia bacterium]
MANNSNRFTSVKVFSATTPDRRAALGEEITRWLSEHPAVDVVDRVVTQSSDDAFHCLAITLFYNVKQT